ncbi:MAG: sigma-54-dependent Fis family transcriptional regulator [Deltaproteobacteria bacterium]|nr:sigma-54-dependent Fis family transcriptional regulator [Deltaproteobacteria bacterium]
MTDTVRILATDDDQDALFALAELLSGAGYDVVTASNGNDALEKLQTTLPDIALLDVMMPGLTGFEIIAKAKSDPALKYTPLILLTARDTLEDIVHGFEQGADDYIKKPYDRSELLARVQAALRTRDLYKKLYSVTEDNKALRKTLEGRSGFTEIVGKSPSIQDVLGIIDKVAKSTLPVLITGESGTGKELIARAVHQNSDRADQAFVVQNCSTFNEQLLESELFGHVKGAFTGAQGAKKGLFEVADGGTFFLDELGEMSPQLQAKLLRVLQDGSFIPVGDTREKKVDVRIVAATNKDLKKLIQEGKFREDLYYRICVVHVALPSLRERRSDISTLIQHFLEKYAKSSGKEVKVCAESTLQKLVDYSWPGNIRQLENEISRLVVLSGENQVIQPDLLSPEIKGVDAQSVGLKRTAGDLKDAIESLEKDMIAAALEQAAGNKSEAARELGISRSNLISKVQAYGLESKEVGE